MGKRMVLSITLIVLFSPVAHAQRDSVFVTMSGDTVKVWNTDIPANCATRFEVGTVLSENNTFTITERDTVARKARCICTFDLFVVLPGITRPGNYSVGVYRQQLKQFGYPVDTTVFVGAAQFTIVSQAAAQISGRFYQSNCHNTPDAVETGVQLPSRIWLYQSYPNPFNPSTSIKYELPKASHVTLVVFDVLGREVSVLVNEMRGAGVHEVKCDGTGLSGGVYIYQLQAAGSVHSRKMLVIK
jgi:hypothetical protein